MSPYAAQPENPSPSEATSTHVSQSSGNASHSNTHSNTHTPPPVEPQLIDHQATSADAEKAEQADPKSPSQTTHDTPSNPAVTNFLDVPVPAAPSQ